MAVSARCWGLVGVLAVLSVVVGCAPAQHVVISVDRPDAPADQPIHITVSGLQQGQAVTIAASTVDRTGAKWASSAQFTADARGQVDLADAQPTSSPDAYQHPAAMGLFWSMGAASGDRSAIYRGGASEAVDLTVTAGSSTLATAKVIRRFGTLSPRQTTLAAEGFLGAYWTPPKNVTKRPGILLIGGSDGGLPGGAFLAEQGYPTLAIAYFKAPGLPTSLNAIPLEYFTRALAWLAAQPEVDSAHVLAYGVSRGSEAALLLGVNFPNLVHGVVALVPSNVAICGFPGCAGPAWTLKGLPVPYTRQFDIPLPTDVPAAVIPVERIQGPVFLDCGGADTTWVSCSYAAAIMTRLDRANGFPHTLLKYPDAGHGVGSVYPYLPLSSPVGLKLQQLDGATPEANPRARAEVWPQLLAFLGSV